MNTRKTKLELQQDNQRLGAENLALRKRISELEMLTHIPPREYPLLDGMGRRYRLEGKVRCYPRP